MNPLMEQMLEATNTRDLELIELEDLFAQDCECEANNHGDADCTHSVTHFFRNCMYEQKICATRTAYVVDYKSRWEGFGCGNCHSPSSECWTIRPI